MRCEVITDAEREKEGTLVCFDMLTCNIMALRSAAAAWSFSHSSIAARLAAAACSGVSTGSRMRASSLLHNMCFFSVYAGHSAGAYGQPHQLARIRVIWHLIRSSLIWQLTGRML